MTSSFRQSLSFSQRGRGDSGSSGGLLRAPSFLTKKGGDTASVKDGKVGKPQYLAIKIERLEGSFGLQLNDHNRVTQVKAGSASEKAKLKPFDRIIKVDGAELAEDKLATIAAGKEALLLDIERPPASAYKTIVDHENTPGSSPYEFSDANLTSRREPEEQIPEALLKSPGKQTATVVLSREPDGQFGLEVSLDNEVIAVDVDSAAHKAGLLVKDKITKVDGKPLTGPIAEVLMTKGVSQNMVLTVLRGHSVNARLSITPQGVSADL